MTAGDLGVTCVAAAELAAFGQQVGTGGTMNGAVNPTSPEKRGVCGIDDGVDLERRNVRDEGLQPHARERGDREGCGRSRHRT